jgi:tetratricopeptide (TPR) repeat protein
MIVGPDPLLPSPTEQVMVDMMRLVADREFASIDEANAFLRDVTASGPPASELPSTPLARAQRLVYQAMDVTGRQRVALARKALDQSKDCADAYIILATETARSQREELRLFHQALEAAERALEGSGYEEHVPHLWGFMPARPLLRALFGLGLAEWQRGARFAAVEHLRRLLSLNEEDPQAARYYLLGWLLYIDDHVLSRELVNTYREKTAVWLWGDALLTFKEEGEFGAGAVLRRAMRANPLVPDLILEDEDEEDKRAPRTHLQTEALVVADYLGHAWIRDFPAMWWLGEQLEPEAGRHHDERPETVRREGATPEPDDDLSVDDPSGLDDEALDRLFAAPLGMPACAVVVREDLSPAELESSTFLFNARLFLERASPADVRATAKGNLNEAFVRLMVDGMRLSPDEERWFGRHKPKREDDFSSLAALRAVLIMAGLLEQKPRSFAVTDLGFQLLATERAGILQAHLFNTFFGPFDLSLLDQMDADPVLQGTFPYTLYMMSRDAGDWLTPEQFREAVLMEDARDREAEMQYMDESFWRFESRIVRPLIAFGLLEQRPDPNPPADGSIFQRHYQVRRSPLFDRFLGFDLG